MLTYLIVFKTVVTDLHLIVSVQYIFIISENNSGKSNSVVIHVQYQCSVSFFFFFFLPKKRNIMMYFMQLFSQFSLSFSSLPSLLLPFLHTYCYHGLEQRWSHSYKLQTTLHLTEFFQYISLLLSLTLLSSPKTSQIIKINKRNHFIIICTYCVLGYFLYDPLFYFTQESLDIYLCFKYFSLTFSHLFIYLFLCHNDILFTLSLLKRTWLLSTYLNLVGSYCGVFFM